MTAKALHREIALLAVVAVTTTACGSADQKIESVALTCTVTSGAVGWPTGNTFSFSAPGHSAMLLADRILWCSPLAGDVCGDRVSVDRRTGEFQDEARKTASDPYAFRYGGTCDMQTKYQPERPASGRS